MAAQCDSTFCFIKRFERSPFNFCDASLQYIDAQKGRGLVAEETLEKGTVVALFPGAESHRIPQHGTLPLADMGSRHASERLDEQQDALPLSSYAISVSVSDFDATEAERGFHWRVLEPCLDDTAGAAAEMAFLWAEHRALDWWTHDELEAIPEHVQQLVAFKARSLYERLKMQRASKGALRHLPQPRMGDYEFLLDTTQVTPHVMLHAGERLHFVCDVTQIVAESAYCQRNIALALNSEFDVKRHKRLALAERAKALRVSDAYPHMACFVNEPHDHETPNLTFLDPNDWVPQMSHRDPRRAPRHAALIREAQLPLTAERLDYLQRQCLVTTRRVPCGEELLLKYNRSRFP